MTPTLPSSYVVQMLLALGGIGALIHKRGQQGLSSDSVPSPGL